MHPSLCLLLPLTMLLPLSSLRLAPPLSARAFSSSPLLCSAVPPAPPEGLLSLHKPKGMTSFAVVGRVRALLVRCPRTPRLTSPGANSLLPNSLVSVRSFRFARSLPSLLLFSLSSLALLLRSPPSL